MIRIIGKCLFLSMGRLYQISSALIGFFLFVDSLEITSTSLFTNRVKEGLIGIILIISAVIVKLCLNKFDNIERIKHKPQ